MVFPVSFYPTSKISVPKSISLYFFSSWFIAVIVSDRHSYEFFEQNLLPSGSQKCISLLWGNFSNLFVGSIVFREGFCAIYIERPRLKSRESSTWFFVYLDFWSILITYVFDPLNYWWINLLKIFKKKYWMKEKVQI